MFRNKAWKWLVLGGAITVILLYMLEMTTTGIERIYGPLDETAAAAQSQTSNEKAIGLIPIEAADDTQASDSFKTNFTPESPIDKEIAALEAEIAELKRLALLKEKEELQQKLLLNEDAAKPAVNRVADTTSEVLQNASSSGLQFIAKLFSNVID
ncbi:hypothetical protein [Paenibacillus sp. FSL W7-1287]|uniref:hypothetical protein n=1 Tax=Paenibacillus sp. FSL W7-1287 TaxID=2954538 RepID=UPI0030F94B80